MKYLASSSFINSINNGSYKTLGKWVAIIAAVAIGLSTLALLVALNAPVNRYDFQGASGMATLLPAFSGIIISVFALYHYVKIEDPIYKAALNIYLSRRELINAIEFAVLGPQHIINKMKSDIKDVNETEKKLDHIQYYLDPFKSILEKAEEGINNPMKDLLAVTSSFSPDGNFIVSYTELLVVYSKMKKSNNINDIVINSVLAYGYLWRLRDATLKHCDQYPTAGAIYEYFSSDIIKDSPGAAVIKDYSKEFRPQAS